MKGLTNYWYSHFLMALPVIVIIAVVKFGLRRNRYTASYADDI